MKDVMFSNKSISKSDRVKVFKIIDLITNY